MQAVQIQIYSRYCILGYIHCIQQCYVGSIRKAIIRDGNKKDYV